MALHIVLAVATLALAVAAYLDVNSTLQFLKRGTAHEGNPLMAWLQRSLPATWPYIKVGATLALGAGALLILPAALALGAIALLALYYLITALANYSLSK
jgi:hypothetical protein